jgi:hypothetical protein
MPHDVKGRLLKLGDEVVIRGKITQLQTGEEFCNVSVEIAPMPPYTERSTLSALNTKQCELVEAPAAT